MTKHFGNEVEALRWSEQSSRHAKEKICDIILGEEALKIAVSSERNTEDETHTQRVDRIRQEIREDTSNLDEQTKQDRIITKINLDLLIDVGVRLADADGVRINLEEGSQVIVQDQ